MTERIKMGQFADRRPACLARESPIETYYYKNAQKIVMDRVNFSKFRPFYAINARLHPFAHSHF